MERRNKYSLNSSRLAHRRSYAIYPELSLDTMAGPKDLREELEPLSSTITIVFEYCLCCCQNMQHPVKTMYGGVAMKGQANTRTSDIVHHGSLWHFALSIVWHLLAHADFRCSCIFVDQVASACCRCHKRISCCSLLMQLSGSKVSRKNQNDLMSHAC